ncbi:MAG TPA: bifunctional 23S rRNA (guanine(2069)-N(7))-methyltransferase RlmK/23S rRNA (guanine(2445)-N(2))-methyltransferase RlmL [Rhodanobacteraceae bacterium]|nr:bifunctional 23S rRNA (guanine(2069)-N(7))-methyltransferase RlmK/23S rRNA (guanine(2445)-N(2))-methyltransferase RlmL [Rhodanobacteraceae bacterium]
MSRWFATCAKGLEYLLRDELAALGAAEVHEARAGVHFEGALEIAYRACLESRLAGRILLPLAEFAAPDDAALYAGVAAIDWAEQMAPTATLAVDAVCTQSAIQHSRFAAQRVKDAIVDQFRERAGTRPDVDLEQPDLRLNLHLKRDQATLSVDLAGQPLHRRGWRTAAGAAPLKEDLAAAILLRAGWPAIHAAGGRLVDPMCGAGTLLIEGALMAAGVAPGLHREYFGLLGWRGHDDALWQRLRSEARERADAGLRALKPLFFGSDVDAEVLGAARHNAQAAGVAGFMQLTRREAGQVTAPEGETRGLVVCNPPYGERLGARESLPPLYRALGQVLRQHFANWQAAIITAAEGDLGHALGLRAHKHYQLFNGAIECVLLLFDLAPPPVREPRPLTPGEEMLHNRLRKTWRHVHRRAQREGLHGYRIYDRDLPEYAAAVDVYEACPLEAEGPLQRWLHVQEYQAPADVPAELARQRVRELTRALAEVCEVPRERMALKTRRRGKGGARYGRLDRREEWLRVDEDGLDFIVNLFDAIDTGLFLDHRLVRARLRQLASGRDFLNLFAYTGAGSVHAAAGSASRTTTVDLSSTYLDWASRNLALNGFTGPRHRLMQADAQAFVADDRGRYGLIYVDPPTFSNSARAEDFDVQRDHARLLLACRERLRDDGVLVFSNNYRRFRLDAAALGDAYDIEDWSAASIPFDFTRNRAIHGCWLLRPR